MANKTCSACFKEDPTVDRDMFDGMCADCTDRALYDGELAAKAKEMNSLMRHEEWSNERAAKIGAVEMVELMDEMTANIKPGGMRHVAIVAHEEKKE